MEWAGDPFQVGGTFVLGAGNTCDYVYRSSYAGDHPPIAELLAAATGKTSGGEEIVCSAGRWAKRLSVSGIYRGSSSRTKRDCPVAPSTVASLASALEDAASSDARDSSLLLPGLRRKQWLPCGRCCGGSCSSSCSCIRFWQWLVALAVPVVPQWTGPTAVLSHPRPCCALFLQYRRCGSLLLSSEPLLLHDDVKAIPCRRFQRRSLQRPRILEEPFGGQRVKFMKTAVTAGSALGFRAGLQEKNKACTVTDSQSSLHPKKSPLLVNAAPRRTWDPSLGVNEYGIMLQYIRKFLEISSWSGPFRSRLPVHAQISPQRRPPHVCCALAWEKSAGEMLSTP